MAYSVIIPPIVEEQIDRCVSYLTDHLHNQQAASKLLDEITIAINRLEDNPHAYDVSHDLYLASLGYREVNLKSMDYHFVFRIVKENVHILGFFHGLEDYLNKTLE